MDTCRALMLAVHTLLNQKPEVPDHERNLAAIEIMNFIKEAETFGEKLNQFLLEKIATKMQERGMGAEA